MTWARTLQTGSGLTELDLVIAGSPYIITTDPALDGTTDASGREYVSGLDRQSLTTEEALELGAPRCRARGPTARVVDVRGRCTRLFARQPTRVAYLAASLTTSATTVQVSQPIFANGDVIHVGIEAMLVTAGGLTTTLTVTRGVWGTVPQAHPIEDGAAMRTPEVTDWPASMEGRSCVLRAYGQSEATPTEIWRGRVVRDAELDDLATWSIACDSPMAALAQPLGDDLRGSMLLRGIVYGAGWPLVLELASGTDTARIEFGRSGGDSPESIANILAFFRSQQSFCEALSAEIVAATASWTAPLVGPSGTGRRLQAVVDAETGGWYLAMTTGAVPVDLSIRLRSPVDLGDMGTRRGVAMRRTADGSYASVATLAATTTYAIGWDGGGGVIGPAVGPTPRGCIGRPRAPERGRPVPSGFTQRHLFVDGAAGTVSAVRIGDATIAVASVDAARNAVLLDRSSVDAALTVGITYAGTSPSMMLTREYGIGDAYTLLADIVSVAPSESARGAVPWIEASEVDLAATLGAVEAASERGAPRWARSRLLSLSEPVELDEALGAEAALFGGVIAPGPDGRIRIVLPEVRPVTSAGSTDLDSAALIDSGGPGYARSAYGVVNTVVLKTGYRDGEWDGPTYRVRDVTAFGRNRAPRVIEIEPRFRSLDEETRPPTTRDAVAVARPWLALLARPYSLATLDVDYRAFGVGVGDSVLLTAPMLPDAGSGERGIVRLPGVCIGRRWDHGRGRGQLRVLVSHERIAGYTPTSRIDVRTLVSGTTYDLLLSSPQPGGYADAEIWQVGDGVSVIEHDVASPIERYGTVVSVDVVSGIVRATFDAAIPAAPLNLRYDMSPFVQASQRPYAWIAGEASRDEGFSPSRPARTYQ